MVSDVNISSITIQWEAVDCIHQNGKIIGYTVKYVIQGRSRIQTVNVSGAATEAIISGLTKNTVYAIEVAAVNSAGIGKYSLSMTAITSSKNIWHQPVSLDWQLLFAPCTYIRCNIGFTSITRACLLQGIIFFYWLGVYKMHVCLDS